MFRREAGGELPELKCLISVKSMLCPGTLRGGSKENTNGFMFSTLTAIGEIALIL